MKILSQNRGKLPTRAFAMMDVLVSMGLIGITLVSLYAGLSLGFAIIQSARENLRATQIIMEKFETIRLYTWDQVNSNGFIPPTFTSPYAFNDPDAGFDFRGQLTVAPVAAGNSYNDDMRMVTVRVNWNSGGLEDGVPRSREMVTYISRFGLQSYVY